MEEAVLFLILMLTERFHEVIAVHPVRDVNVCTKFHANTSNICSGTLSSTGLKNSSLAHQIQETIEQQTLGQSHIMH